jgi:GPH family glycoside/pentoside/hexuronide:cation symporter
MLLAMIPAIFIKSKSTLNETSFSPLTFKTMGGSLKEIFFLQYESYLTLRVL